MSDECEVKYCTRDYHLTYYTRRVCLKHWLEYCNKRINLKDKTIYKKEGQ